MEGIIGNKVAMPLNATAWLRDNAKAGAMLYTRDGQTVALIGTKTTYGDPDKGTQQHPLYAPTYGNGKGWANTSTKPALD